MHKIPKKGIKEKHTTMPFSGAGEIIDVEDDIFTLKITKIQIFYRIN